jgi:hypothetical protein
MEEKALAVDLDRMAGGAGLAKRLDPGGPPFPQPHTVPFRRYVAPAAILVAALSHQRRGQDRRTGEADGGQYCEETISHGFSVTYKGGTFAAWLPSGSSLDRRSAPPQPRFEKITIDHQEECFNDRT